MKKKTAVIAAVCGGVLSLAAFHVIHHQLYCKYRTVPGKSHCAVCGHRRICQKVHHRRGGIGVS